THEPRRQDVQEEPAYELDRSQGHHLFLPPVCVVFGPNPTLTLVANSRSRSMNRSLGRPRYSEGDDHSYRRPSRIRHQCQCWVWAYEVRAGFSGSSSIKGISLPHPPTFRPLAYRTLVKSLGES